MRSILLALFLVVSLLTVACGGKKPPGQSAPVVPAATPAGQQAAAKPAEAQPAAGSLREVFIESTKIEFSISELKAKAGETVKVTFNNGDEEKHNLVVIDHGVVSPDVKDGAEATFEWTMPAKAGTYRVVCAYHPAMAFKLIVE